MENTMPEVVEQVVEGVEVLQALPEAVSQPGLQKKVARLSAVGITRKNKEESKARRKMAKSSRKKNRGK